MQTAVERIAEIIEPSLESRDYRLVRVKFVDNAKRRTLQIMAERKADGQMEVGDCETLSRLVSALLDVEDPISGAYNLEVSSPGVDRPLVRIEDFTEYLGHRAKIETHGLINGRKRFKGELLGVEGKEVSIQVDDESYAIPISAIAQAQLLLTDKLMAMHEERRKQTESLNTAVS